MINSARLTRQRGGVQVYEYPIDRHMPPVLLARVGQEKLSAGGQIHNFPALWYDRAAGVAYVVALGATIGPAAVECAGDGVAVFFNPAAFGDDGASPWLTWRSHPLLCLFLHEQHGGLLRLELPPDHRPAFDSTLDSMKSELVARDQGYREAVVAHLTLLLTKLGRLARDVIGTLRHGGEPLLAEVFKTIDRRYTEPLSLSDVAREVAVSPGYLTTLVRRHTGRTVLDWIAERRMGEARRLLTDSRLSIAEVAARVGVPDAAYFTRLFRQAHNASPSTWRNHPASTSRRL